MIKHVSIAVGALALALGTSACAAPAMQARTTTTHAIKNPAAFFKPGGVFKPSTALGTHAALKTGSRAIQYSSNWSGYAVTGGTFSSVSAYWTQKAISCSSSDTDTDMSPWVGIDGYSSSTVEQTGSSGDCSGATATYYAWYEMYPSNYVTINHTVKAGDAFYGSVTHTSGTSYKLELEDITEGWTYTVTKSLSADDSSAEAIMEMAADELSKWSGTDPFTSVTVDGSPVGDYSSSDIQQMEIESGSTVCDTTSSLSSSEDFTTTWKNLC